MGESGIMASTRIHEHMTTLFSAVYEHMINIHDDTPNNNNLTWKILHAGLPYENKRRMVEALYIKQHNNVLMNGCIGRMLCV